MEVLFYDLVTDRELVGLIHEGRKMLGDEITMAVDFGYRWHNWHDALFVLERVADANIFFAEATLQHDDLAGHARLAERSSIRIGGAEAAATRFEVREWLTVGKVGVVQPNIGRGGGLTEIRRIADMCELAGAEVVPHGWKTGITSAAGQAFPGGMPGRAGLRICLAACLRQPAPARTRLARAGSGRRLHGTADRTRPWHGTERGTGRTLAHRLIK